MNKGSVISFPLWESLGNSLRDNNTNKICTHVTSYVSDSLNDFKCIDPSISILPL